MAKEPSEHPTPPAAASSAPAVTPDDLVRAIAGMTAEQRAALFAAAAPPPSPGERKFSVSLFALAKGKYASVIEACKKGLAIAASPDTANDPEAQIAPLRQVDPNLANAAIANAIKRGKPITHCFNVVIRWIGEVGSKLSS